MKSQDPKDFILFNESKKLYKRRNGSTGQWQYYHLTPCGSCGTKIYTTRCGSHRADVKHFCNIECRTKYNQAEESEEEIIIPKIIDRDIGYYLTFGRIYPLDHSSASKAHINISRSNNQDPSPRGLNK